MTDSLFSKEEVLQIYEIIKKNWNNEGSYSDLLTMEFLFMLKDYIDSNKPICKDIENKIKEFFVSSEVKLLASLYIPFTLSSTFLKLMPEEIKNKIILITL